jgi:hypothetical protein
VVVEDDRALRIEFCGETYQVNQGETISFGRFADICIDDNAFLHRKLGVFSSIRDEWWIENVGSEIPLHIFDRSSASHVVVAPGSRSPLSYGSAIVRFSAASLQYELEIEQPIPESVPVSAFDGSEGDSTVRVSGIRLNTEQRLLLAAIAMPWLRSGSTDGPLPSNSDTYQRLGWTRTKYNRKLDYLCERFEKEGWRGMRGERDGLALYRRQNLVKAAIDARLITLQDIPPEW